MLLITQGAAATATAPADRYFGKLKMSALRIRYETMQLKKRYETHELLPYQAEHLLLLTEDSFRDWAQRYPRDPWLASTGFAMAQLYAELPGNTSRDHAVALFVLIKSRFPGTLYAQKSRDALHRGVSTKPEPAWAASPAVSPTSMPATTPGVAAPTPASSPSATPYPPVRPTAAR